MIFRVATRSWAAALLLSLGVFLFAGCGSSKPKDQKTGDSGQQQKDDKQKKEDEKAAKEKAENEKRMK